MVYTGCVIWITYRQPCIIPESPHTRRCFWARIAFWPNKAQGSWSNCAQGTLAMNLSLVDAFAKFGAKPTNRQRARSAIAADGAMVLNCLHGYFGHPAQGVLRYEDRLSRDSTDVNGTGLLSKHLTLARDGALPVRMVVTSVVTEKSPTRSFHVRSDLIGKVVTFDGDHFIIDFTRQEEIKKVAAGRGK